MEPNDPIWKLLGRSPLPETDAWFAARTVARLRRERRPSWKRRLMGALVWASSTAVVAVLAVHFWSGPTRSSSHPVNTAKVQDALNFIADRGAETDFWLANNTL